MKLNKAKCLDLHMGQGNHQYQYTLSDKDIESSPADEDFGVVVNEKLDMSRQCVRAA